MLLALVGCGGSAGGTNPAVESPERCVTDDGVDICAAMGLDQVRVAATANGNEVELYSSDGDPVNTFLGEGMLVTSGDQFEVVCYRDGTWGDFGVILTEEFDVAGESTGYFANGMVDGTNWLPVVFLGTNGVEGPDSVQSDLAERLEAQYDDVNVLNSCNDPRIVIGSLGKAALDGTLDERFGGSDG